MKKSIPIILLLLLFSLTASDAQLLTLFNAGDGLAKAKEIAIDSGLVDPILIGLGTTAMDLEILDGVQLEYNMDEGTSNAWIYLLQASGNPDDRIAIGVVKILVLYLGMAIPVSELPSMPFNPEGSIEDYEWIDSDKMAENLNADQAFIEFQGNNNNVSMNALALGLNQIPPLTIGDPYWIGMFTSDNGDIACYTHAVDGSVNCFEITDVEAELEKKELSIYPNPAHNLAIITIPESLQHEHSFMALYNINGEMIMEFAEIPRYGEHEQVLLPLTSFTSGSYYIMYYTIDGPVSLPLKIVR